MLRWEISRYHSHIPDFDYDDYDYDYDDYDYDDHDFDDDDDDDNDDDVGHLPPPPHSDQHVHRKPRPGGCHHRDVRNPVPVPGHPPPEVGAAALHVQGDESARYVLLFIGSRKCNWQFPLKMHCELY